MLAGGGGSLDPCDPGPKRQSHATASWGATPSIGIGSARIEYKHILAALIDSEQMLLSIKAHQCSTTFVLNLHWI